MRLKALGARLQAPVWGSGNEPWVPVTIVSTPFHAQNFAGVAEKMQKSLKKL